MTIRELLDKMRTDEWWRAWASAWRRIGGSYWEKEINAAWDWYPR